MCQSGTIRSEYKCAQAPTVHLIAQVSAAKSTKAKIIVRPRVRVNSLFPVEAASWPAEISRFSASSAQRSGGSVKYCSLQSGRLRF